VRDEWVDRCELRGFLYGRDDERIQEVGLRSPHPYIYFRGKLGSTNILDMFEKEFKTSDEDLRPGSRIFRLTTLLGGTVAKYEELLRN